MSDSTAIEAIASAIVELGLQSSEGAAFDAHVILAALRDAGVEIYRPDECAVVEVSADEEPPTVEAAPGLYRLVPVEGEK